LYNICPTRKRPAPTENKSFPPYYRKRSPAPPKNTPAIALIITCDLPYLDIIKISNISGVTLNQESSEIYSCPPRI
jgi:hypothetical protein